MAVKLWLCVGAFVALITHVVIGNLIMMDSFLFAMNIPMSPQFGTLTLFDYFRISITFTGCQTSKFNGKADLTSSCNIWTKERKVVKLLTEGSLNFQQKLGCAMGQNVNIFIYGNPHCVMLNGGKA